MEFDGFDWDDGNSSKCCKHGVSITEIETLFAGVIAIAPDLKHSADEERFKAIGQTYGGRYVLVAFTMRRKETSLLLRPVSARYMHHKEIAFYEKAFANSENG
jgi:uncharacterized DUF497 family protein